MTILPPTGFRLTPATRRYFHEPLVDGWGVQMTVDPHEDAIYLRPLREGDAIVNFEKTRHDGRPVYFGPPESPKPIAVRGPPHSYSAAVSLTGKKHPDCPACHGKGIVNSWASPVRAEELDVLSKYGLDTTGCHQCGETTMRAFPWRAVCAEESTGIEWVEWAGDTEKEVTHIMENFCTPPAGCTCRIERARP